MQVKQINTPLHTPQVTLLMHNLQAHARATVRATGKRSMSYCLGDPTLRAI
jgi:hypothetical protein